VLVTGFEPFGLIRGHVPLLKGNRSQQLLEMLRERFGAQDFEYLILPVDRTAVDMLGQHLTLTTAGAFMMGEDLLARMRIETTSYDPRAQLGVGPFQVRTPGARAAVSPFAAELAGELKGQAGVSTDSGIGTFFCNRVYWRGQEWGESNGRPTVFIHVGPFQSVDIQYQRVSQMLKELLVSARQDQKSPRSSGNVYV
jgi:pyrrolidone-carboxylate peptidase